MTRRIYYSKLSTPIGELLLTSDGSALTGVYLADHLGGPARGANWYEDAEVLRDAREQLTAYFAGTLTAFDLALAPSGTPFQLGAWEKLSDIPYGTTISYREQARRLDCPKAARAVGSANGRNPLSIVVPCHRVIASGGGLGGYGGGLDRKRWLLEHEAAVLARASQGSPLQRVG
jgi:methylated-DNA-[protein]-cysteine S-methyltransferase